MTTPEFLEKVAPEHTKDFFGSVNRVIDTLGGSDTLGGFQVMSKGCIK